jgi:hypothetical protein
MSGRAGKKNEKYHVAVISCQLNGSLLIKVSFEYETAPASNE